LGGAVFGHFSVGVAMNEKQFSAGTVYCPTCGRSYFKDKHWKRACASCYFAWKGTLSVEAPANPPIDATMVRRLLQLCHPDRHGGSEAATVATQFLLELRGKL